MTIKNIEEHFKHHGMNQCSGFAVVYNYLTFINIYVSYYVALPVTELARCQ